jgi:hypothetical protein
LTLVGRDEVSASNQLIAASFVEIVPREPVREP